MAEIMINTSNISDKFAENRQKYAIYLRKSRQDIEAEALGEGETLARHYNMLMKLAERQNILPEQISIYKEVVSGDSISERPEMQKLLNDVYRKKYAGVLVVEVERLARGNTKDQGEVSDAFQYGNTKIITPVKTYDPQNEFDQEYFEFGLFMSRREYKTIKRRMEAGRKESVSEGNYCGSSRPYGYDIRRVNKKERILVEKPEESKYVRMIFDWFTVDHLSAGQIARNLTAMHVPTMSGNIEWNRATVADILKNVHYTGKVRWNRRRCSKEYDSETGTLSKKKRRLTPEDYAVYQGKHKAIISQDQFDLAQSLFTGIIPIKANETLTNPFAGLIRCAHCGKAIHYDSYAGKSNVQPRFMHVYSTTCKLKSLSADTVIEAIEVALKLIMENYEVEMKRSCADAELIRYQDMIQALESELEKQEKKRRRLFDAFEEGIYDSNEFIERKQNVNAVIEEIKKQVQNAKKSAPEPIDYGEKIVKIHDLIDCIQDRNIDVRAKNAFLKSVIDYISYDVIDYGRQKGGKPILEIHLL